jgi:inorganic triphosphatase YgiF
MPQHSQVEIERKYDVDADTTPPVLVGVGAVAVEAEPETAELVATYFDTPELTLAHARIAVRARRGGHDEGWHVKLAPGEEGRVELHWPLSEGDGDEPPAALREAVDKEAGGALGDLPLTPIARIVNTRVTTVLRDAAGFDLAELCDDHVRGENLRSGGSESWREWEVELLGGAPDSPGGRSALLDGIEQRLLEAGARQAGTDSKLQRVLSL